MRLAKRHGRLDSGAWLERGHAGDDAVAAEEGIVVEVGTAAEVDSSAVEVHIAVQTDIAPVTDAPHMACLVVYRRYGVACDYRYIAAMDSGEDRVTHLILWKTTPWQRD